MEPQNKWKYCEETLESHYISRNYSECIEPLRNLCIAEGAKKSPFSEEKCINIDKVESLLAQKEKRNAQKTMDLSFGLNNGQEKKILLCELRLNYKNVNNLRKSELDSKINYSKKLLGHQPPIFKPYFFIFKSTLKNQAYRVLRRLYFNKKIVEALDLKDLKNEFF